MRFSVVGNKADVCFVQVKNSTTSIIEAGSPVFLALNGTDDGLAITNGNAAGAALNSVCIGLLTNALAPSAQGEAQVYGIAPLARMVTGTRAASTNNWDVSITSIALGDVLIPVTLSGVNGLTRNTAGATGTSFPGAFVAAGTQASLASTSATTGSALVRTNAIKVFVRMI